MMGGASPNHSMVAAALDEDDVAVDAVVERRDLDGASARQRDSWCFTMRATPLQNWQPLISRLSRCLDARCRLLQRRAGLDRDGELAIFLLLHRMIARA